MEPVRDFLVDSDGDLAIVNGDFATIAGEKAVLQGIKCRVQMFEGECFLDESVGLPWLTQILVKGANTTAVRAILTSAIAATPDVTAVTGAQLQFTSRRDASISYEVTTIYSSVPLAGKVDTP